MEAQEVYTAAKAPLRVEWHCPSPFVQAGVHLAGSGRFLRGFKERRGLRKNQGKCLFVMHTRFFPPFFWDYKTCGWDFFLLRSGFTSKGDMLLVLNARVFGVFVFHIYTIL